jgi:hypothetical protein
LVEYRLTDFAYLLTLLIYVGALVAVLLIPEIYDIRRSYNDKDKLLVEFKPLIDSFNRAATPVPGGQKIPESPKLEDYKELIDKLTGAPEGLEGLGRVVMTLGVIAIVGIAVIQLLLSSTLLISNVVSARPPLFNQTLLTFADKARSDQVEIIKTLVTILGGALTTMIGFYFGTKAAEKKSEGATQPASGKGKEEQQNKQQTTKQDDEKSSPATHTEERGGIS